MASLDNEKNHLDQTDLEYPRPPGWGKRHTQVLISFIALTIAMAMRVNMGLAIVAMTDPDKNSAAQTYNWDKKTQDMILSAFFWGYLLGNIPGGIISYRFGSKLPIMTSLIINGITSLLLPSITNWGGAYATCAFRVVQGLAQSVTYPSLNTMLGKWAPVTERGTMCGLVFGGSQSGTLIMMPLAGLLASTSIGWPLIFYVCGVISLIWGLVYGWLGATSPSEHSTITEAERDYITSSLPPTRNTKGTVTPWKSIFTSMPVWAIMTTQAGSNWMYVTLLTELPTYLKKILNVDIKSNGMFSCLPYLTMFITNFFICVIFDTLVVRKILTVRSSRVIANTIAMWGGCLMLIGFVYSQNSLLFTMFFLSMAMALHSGIHVGFAVNAVDLAPNFAGIVGSISNTAGSLSGTLAPITAGLMLTDPYDPIKWRWVFFVGIGIKFISNLFYIIFASTDLQPWNEPKAEYAEISKDENLKEKE